jgi:uncharacterized protein (DUF305 family)
MALLAAAVVAMVGPVSATGPEPGLPSGPGMMPMMDHHHMMHGGGAMMPGMGMRMGPLPEGDRGPASLAFFGINARMHTDMAIAYSGDVDADFVRGMIPHHQGAVDMAKVVLAFGKDPEVRKLAEGVIQSQQAEIQQMTEWLAKHSR